MLTPKKQAGFTIVELLVVIIVIAILATLVTTAYNGVQAKARDTKRITDLQAIQDALELYHLDNGGYPDCFGGTYKPSANVKTPHFSACLGYLSPKYLPSNVQDPINSNSYQYLYGVGLRKTGSVSFTIDKSDNYILGDKLEASSGSQYGGWGFNDLNYLAGSNN